MAARRRRTDGDDKSALGVTQTGRSADVDQKQKNCDILALADALYVIRLVMEAA